MFFFSFFFVGGNLFISMYMGYIDRVEFLNIWILLVLNENDKELGLLRKLL